MNKTQKQNDEQMSLKLFPDILKRAEARPTVDDMLKCLRGNPETFREILTDKDKLLQKICSFAKWKAEQKGVPPWSIIGEITGHGSGVSSCIYELYREYK